MEIIRVRAGSLAARLRLAVFHALVDPTSAPRDVLVSLAVRSFTLVGVLAGLMGLVLLMVLAGMIAHGVSTWIVMGCLLGSVFLMAVVMWCVLHIVAPYFLVWAASHITSAHDDSQRHQSQLRRQRLAKLAHQRPDSSETPRL